MSPRNADIHIKRIYDLPSAPPLVISREDLDTSLDRFVEAIREFEAS